MHWEVERESGRAADLHRRSGELASSSQPRRSARLMQVTAPAVVLGSAQPQAEVDWAAAGAAGVDVARRRSGGGAVYVSQRAVVWVDIVVPAGDRLWDPDVGRATWWVGDVWASALDSVGVGGGVVWRRPMRRTEWSGRICFAGVGPGEVLVSGAKVVGLSQRRTRTASLFQTAALVRWRPRQLTDLLRFDPAERERAAVELAGVAVGVGEQAATRLFDAFVSSLPD
jgi:lipoate-protein ligase A